MTTKHGVDPIFTRESLQNSFRLYAARQDPEQPLLAQAGSNEVLLDDSTRLATRSAAAGVDVILDVTAGVPHVFQSFAGSPDEADGALDRAGRFILDRWQYAHSGI